MSDKDYYKILGVLKDASKDEIKKAYRALAHKHHPDKGGEEKKFKEINEAYQVLGDDQKRAQYDQFGSAAFDGAGAGGPQGGYGPFGFNFSGFNNATDDGRFGFDGFEDIFESFFGGGGGAAAGQGRKSKRGSDIMIEAELSFEEAALGTKRSVNLYSFKECPKCSGSGVEQGSKLVKCKACNGKGKTEKLRKTMFGTIAQYVVCETCSGTGEVPEKVCSECSGEGRKKETRTEEIKIPAGIENGHTIKFDGRGNAGPRGSSAGDLYVKVKVADHKLFERRGSDIYYDREISFTQAVLGDKIDIPTLYGDLKLQIPSGTPSGRLLKISGKGAGKLHGVGHGDMYVRILIKTPKSVSKKAKKLLEELKEEGL
jgi:molecular chaperone DnaJ